MLRAEIAALTAARDELYVAPSREWIEHRLNNLATLLESGEESAALALRRYFEPITLSPEVPEVGRPYFEAKCGVKVLPIVEEGRRKSNEGATTSEWWTGYLTIKGVTPDIGRTSYTLGLPNDEVKESYSHLIKSRGPSPRDQEERRLPVYCNARFLIIIVLIARAIPANHAPSTSTVLATTSQLKKGGRENM